MALGGGGCVVAESFYIYINCLRMYICKWGLCSFNSYLRTTQSVKVLFEKWGILQRPELNKHMMKSFQQSMQRNKWYVTVAVVNRPSLNTTDFIDATKSPPKWITVTVHYSTSFYSPETRNWFTTSNITTMHKCSLITAAPEKLALVNVVKTGKRKS